MGDSFYDSFRWLDEDTDIDLSLDNYPQQVNPPSCLMPRRRPSFRRTLSFNSVNISRKSTSLASYGKTPVSSPTTESQSVRANIAGSRSSLSRPTSKSKPRHTSQSSTSSIDPSAQYYHDPEARLKLRVFLTSPQKFDEAIEFGFPALKDGDTLKTPVQLGPGLQIQGFKGTFLDDDDDDDDASIHGDKKGPCSKISRLSYVTENPEDSHVLSFADNKRKSWMPQSEPNPQQTPNTREMTLRMTLTRPDLRADSYLTPTTTTEPTQLPPLTSAHDNSDFCEQDMEDRNLVKKMWRKFRRRKD
ncbi:hypothetical protein BJX76DRAFT_241254 [Aspergillus varians]